MKRLLDKVAIITGGNSGIGRGIAEYFYAEGAQVVIAGQNEKTLREVKSKLTNQVLAIQCDVTKTDHLKNLYQKTMQSFGKIDILVANAGIAERIHVEEASEKDFDRMVNILYRGTFFTIKYALEYLNKPASIILIGSAGVAITLKRHSIYCSAKAAVVKLAKNFSYDLASKGIRINSISPGYIRTPIFDERLKTDPDYLNRREAIIPLRRIGTPQDIAQAALFLASDEASYITGIDLIVDGGYTSSFPEP